MDLRKHFNWVAQTDERARRFQIGFHRQLIRLYRFHIPEGSRVLEWGCGAGELLRGLNPSHGVGIDVSDAMITRANAKEQAGMCEFREGNILSPDVAEEFDHIIMDYLTGYLPDIQTALETVRNSSAHARTRLHITSLNTLWRLPLRWAQALGFVVKQPPSNWLSSQDLINLLELSGWEVLRSKTEQLLPWEIPVLSAFFNRFLVKLPFFRHLGISLHLIARPKISLTLNESPSCSVVVPARNEAGNILAALERIPSLGLQTEIIFVEGNSTDDTWETIQREISRYDGPHIVKAARQPGKGKWDAVRTGFEHATGEVLVIQDADLTAPPEDLDKFYEAIVSGSAEFANGSRLVYPMESEAMRFLNLIGNKTFAIALSYVLGQPVKDSLCGTKMILRSDYNRLMKRIEVLGDFDPFGDYNLLFGASLLDLKIRDIPVRYKDRTYGETNISRFSHGWMLIKMIVFGLCRLKFI
jgi:SAM-dependent methyltransferase